MRPRVVVTGIGVISSAGTDAASFLASVSSARSCLSEVSDPRYRPSIRVMAGRIASVPDTTPRVPADWPGLDRYVQLALCAADQAVRQSGVSPSGLGPRMGAIVGTCSGPTTLIESHYQSILDGNPGTSAAQAFRVGYGSAVRAAARVFGIGGFTATVTTACSAGLTAIGTGADLIRGGLCDAVLAGGADSYSISTQIGFDGLKAPSDGPSAPFSKPTGLCLGEGAAFLVLENLDCALARGAAVLAEILGFGTGNDAHHCSAPDPSGQGQSMAVWRALEDAGAGPEDIGYVNAHGTGTAANDKAETKAIKRVLGPLAARVPVSSQKAVFGHTLGAAGALETATGLLCRAAGVLPPTANFVGNRDGCDLDYVPEAGRAWPSGRCWIKESFAFGGHNAALVLGAAPGPGGVLPPDRRRERVCITGVGVVTPAGAGMEALAQLLKGNAPALRECAPPGHAPIMAALAPDSFEPALERKYGLGRMDRGAALATVAAHLALAHAGVVARQDVAADIGLYLGHSSGSNWAEASFVAELLRNKYVIQSIGDFPFVVPNSTGGTICRALGLRGQNAVFCHGPGAGLMNLVAGALAMANRRVPYLLVGATDVLSQRGWGDPLPDRPLVPSEGAAMFLLESESHVRERGGRALGYIAGLSVATDAMAPWGAAPADGVVRFVSAAAIAQAGLGADEVHGAEPEGLGSRGYFESAGPLLDIAAGLLADDGAICLRAPLLSSVSSRQGVAVSVVLRPF